VNESRIGRWIALLLYAAVTALLFLFALLVRALMVKR